MPRLVEDRVVQVGTGDRAVLGASPSRLVEPMSSAALRTPPPAMRQNIALPQWSRPGVPIDIGAPPLPPSFIRGRAAELAGEQYERIFERASRREVFEEGRHALVDLAADNCHSPFVDPSDGPSRRSDR